MTDTELFERLYGLFDGVTPIAADCGKLCRRRCCKGGRSDGMILFPGEAKISARARGFRISSMEMEGFPVDFAVCRGRCRREDRPLSCRIYPFCAVREDGKFKAVFDPRARYVCPLSAAGEEYILPGFLKAVEDAFELFYTESAYGKAFIEAYGRMLRSYARFCGGL